MDMIVPEWKRILEGKDKFEDLEVEQIVQYLLDKMAVETDPLKITDYNNDLETVLGKGEWLTRKYNRIYKMINEEIREEEERKQLQEKLDRIKKMRDDVVAKIKTKYGL